MGIDYDITVVGGGMVGASCALAAAQQGFQVLLFERSQPGTEWSAEPFDLRVSALTRTSQNILHNLGTWSLMAERRVTAYGHMRVWDRLGLGEIHFSAADVGEPDLGHIVENRAITQSLWQLIQQHPNITTMFGVPIESIDTRDEGSTLTLQDGSSLQAALLVAADGARSQVRELAGIATQGHDYQQHGVVATIQAEQGNQATAWQRFMPTGPLALLPIEDKHFSIVWSTSPEHAQQLLDMSADEFNQALTQASESCCGALQLAGERAAFPLRLQKAMQYVKPSVALLGDAAHVIHPLAGQGVNLGLLDMAVLLDVLVEARARGEALGRFGVLRRYERARKGHNLAVQTAMDAFKHLFSNDNPALYVLRNLGLGLADKIPPLRRQFERVALGYGIELPHLGRLR